MHKQTTDQAQKTASASRNDPIIAETSGSAAICADLGLVRARTAPGIKVGHIVLVIGRQLAYQKEEPRPSRSGATFSFVYPVAIGGSVVCLSSTQ
jgi:hypothetical protein